jgi:GT2 family glycosyltransferase
MRPKLKNAPYRVPHVTIIVVTYKGRSDTLECLESLSHLTYPNHKVIVVDQNSQDGTPDAVRTQYGQVQVVENLVNNGFTGGSNLGLATALKRPTEYVFLLNNDTLVEPEIVEKLITPMEEDSTIGIISPIGLYYEKPNIVCWAGSDTDWRGRSQNYTCDVSIETLDTRIRETGFVASGGMMIRCAVVEEIGLMDDRFFIYFDDNDFCARARRAKWRVVYLPSAKLWHKISRVQALIGDDFGIYHWQRNRLLYLWKHGNPRLFGCLWCIAGAVKSAALLCIRGRRREATVWLRALRDSLTGRWGDTFFSYRR